MIERVVLLKLARDYASPETCQEVAEHSRRVLPALPGVLEAHVGVAADERTAASWDLSLVLRFASMDDLPPYAAHHDHRQYVDQYLKPKLESLTAYNFEV
jgi:hypothetical protein